MERGGQVKMNKGGESGEEEQSREAARAFMLYDIHLYFDFLLPEARKH
jgi:hypothetical protein